MQRPQVHIGNRRIELFIRPFQCVPENLTESGRVGTHLWRAITFWDALPYLLQPLHHETSREVDIHIVFKIDRDIGQAEETHRAYLFHLRQPGHTGLDGKSEKLLHILSGKPGRLGIDIDLSGRHIWKCIDRYGYNRAPTQKSHDSKGNQHQEFIAQRSIYQCFQHAVLLMYMTCAKRRLEHQ